MSKISLTDFFKYFDNDNVNQREAVVLLESMMPKTLLVDKSAWVLKYREPEPVPEGKTSAKGRQLITEFEGCRLTAYPDPGTGGDPWTIGVGHTGAEVCPGMTISQQQADDYLASDLMRFEDAVSRIIKVPFTQDEFDATVSFTFNTGEGALAGSTFTRRINAGEDKPTCFKEEFPKWVNGGNGPMPGLVRRRDAEVKLAVTGQYP